MELAQLADLAGLDLMGGVSGFIGGILDDLEVYLIMQNCKGSSTRRKIVMF